MGQYGDVTIESYAVSFRAWQVVLTVCGFPIESSNEHFPKQDT